MSILSTVIDFLIEFILVSLLLIVFSPLIVGAFSVFGHSIAAFVQPFYKSRRKINENHSERGCSGKGQKQSPGQNQRDSKIQEDQNSCGVQGALESGKGQR